MGGIVPHGRDAHATGVRKCEGSGNSLHFATFRVISRTGVRKWIFRLIYRWGFLSNHRAAVFKGKVFLGILSVPGLSGFDDGVEGDEQFAHAGGH